MSNQPEALKLAEDCDNSHHDFSQAAAELRRQHEEITRLQAECDAKSDAIQTELRRQHEEITRLQAECDALQQIVADYPPIEAELCEVSDRAFKAEAECEALRAKYYDLILSVGQKFPGESRHETAKRYICRAEHSTNNQSSAAAKVVKNG